MKVLFVNTNDTYGGAARAAYRLQSGLIELGIDVTYLVLNKESDARNVICLPSGGKTVKLRVSSKLDDAVLRFYKKRQKTIFTPALFPNSIHKIISLSDVDIVHLHWISNFINISSLAKINKPIVWTLHDMWGFTGGCHYDYQCGRYREKCGTCPHLGSKFNKDLSRLILNKKKKKWGNLDLTIVTPSKWLAECAKSSSLFKNSRVKVIANGLNTNIFKPKNKDIARYALNLPQNKKLILFGAMNPISDRRKGFHYLQPVLERLSNQDIGTKAELVVLGATEPINRLELGMKIHYMGRFQNDIALVLLYSSADVTLIPSLQDNLPNIAMESLACGTPVVAFKVGGMADMVEHKINGYLAQPFNIGDFVDGIRWSTEDDIRHDALSRNARNKVLNDFNIEDVGKKYIKLYEELLKA